MRIAAIVAMALVLAPASARAAAAPAWAIQVVAMPTSFASADSAECVEDERCDVYAVTVTNVGGVASSGQILISDTLPAGVAYFSYRARDLRRSQFEEGQAAGKINCAAAASTVQCTYGESVPSGETLSVSVLVLTEASAGELSLEDRAEVSGGGAGSAASSVVRNSANSPGLPPFGVSDFQVSAYDQGGRVETQAGGHPNFVTARFDLANARTPGVTGISNLPVEDPRTITIELPLGLVGDLHAAAQCPEADLPTKPESTSVGFTSSCPPGSRVGTVVLSRQLGYESSQMLESQSEGVSGLYNMVPEAGYPLVFGFRFINAPILMYARVVPTPRGYRVRITAPNLPHSASTFKILGALLTLFGAPELDDGAPGASPLALFRNPTSCSGGEEDLDARLEVTSWARPSQTIVAQAPVYPAITGCDMLRFEPEVAVQPETSQADSPSGYELTLTARQPWLFGERAVPDLKSASITLPVGVSLSAPVASGLQACSEAQIDPLGTELGEGHAGGNGSPYDDGSEHASPGHCPPASKIGSVEVRTPLLQEPLKGGLFVAQPACGGAERPACTEASANDGELYGLYLEVSGSGVILKLRGTVAADPKTGQLTIAFKDDPQLPFERLSLRLEGGQRAPLANPQRCGEVVAAADIEPWSAPESGPDAQPTAPFAVSGCASPLAFSPGFQAGVGNPVAGESSPFGLVLTRKDGEQDFGGLSVTLPDGLAALTAGVARCEEAQANAGACPDAARIGTAHVAAGSGSEPLWLEGPVYFTGPYRGAPFGLSMAIAAKAGPFDLGTEVVRAAIEIDPLTARVTVVGDPLRLVRDGIPLRLKAIAVTIDRPGFVLNPTGCGREQVSATVAGVLADGSAAADASVASPFVVTGCKSLPFHPLFSVSTEGKTSRADGASLDVKVITPPGSVSAREVHVSMPSQLPARLETLKLACIDRVFDLNPAACPPASAVGVATAGTPILPHPLRGPAYLVSHGGAEFPDLEIVLQGEGVELILHGKTHVRAGITTSTFSTLPDAPVRRFDLTLPQGPHSVLGAPGGKLCTADLAMPTLMRGQDGAAFRQNVKISVAGCKRAIDVVSHSVSGSTATIVARVPAAGVLVAEGAGLSRALARTRRAGRVRVRLALAVDERRFLALRRGRRLQVRALLRFAPRHGKPLRAGVTLLIG
jgi:hypothetical protein